MLWVCSMQRLLGMGERVGGGPSGAGAPLPPPRPARDTWPQLGGALVGLLQAQV